jgi:hypothetical protein
LSLRRKNYDIKVSFVISVKQMMVFWENRRFECGFGCFGEKRKKWGKRLNKKIIRNSKDNYVR